MLRQRFDNIIAIGKIENEIIAFSKEINYPEIPNIQFIQVGSIYNIVSLKSCILFQEKARQGVKIVSKNSEFEIEGEFSIRSAFQIEESVYFINIPKRLLVSYNVLTSEFKELIEYKKTVGISSGKLVFKSQNSIELFDLIKQKKIAEYTIKEFGIDENSLKNVWPTNKYLIIESDDYRFSCFNIKTEKVEWIKKELGRIYVGSTSIISIAHYRICKIRICTGEIILQKDIKPLTESHSFFPTGEHFCDKGYIVVKSSGKPGRIAIFHKENLEFLDVIQNGAMIPLGVENIFVINDFLYTHDWENRLSVYELK